MKKLLGIVVLGLLWCNASFASCGLSKNLDFDVHWSGDSAWRLEFFNHNPQTVTVTKLNYFKKTTGSRQIYRTYNVNIQVRGRSERTYVHSTNMNYDLVKSVNFECVETFKSNKELNKRLKKIQKKKESWFKWWYLIFAIPILGFIIQANEDKDKKKSNKTSSATPSKASSTKSSTNLVDSGNLIEDVWEGRKPLGESFWLYYFILNGIISFGAGFLAEMNDNNIFLIAALISNIWAGVGTWNSSTNYQIQKIKTKQPYGWAYGAKILIVLNFLTIGGQAILLFNL
jgi:hypothetical protein